MSRYIQEVKLTTSGRRLKLPQCSNFRGITKVGAAFVLIYEVWGDPSRVSEVDIKVFKKDEYLNENARYIGNVVVGNDIFHFCYFPVQFDDEGGDGGTPGDVEEHPDLPKEEAGKDDLTITTKHTLAGGMKEI